MLKTTIGGVVVGMANIIPGVSGGTMMVIFGIFTPLMEAISSLTSIKSKDKLKHIRFLIALLLGVAIGLLIFSRVVELAFLYIPTQTLFCFLGMILFSIPILKRKEMSNDAFVVLPFILGCAVIGLMVFFAPEKTGQVITEFPPIELFYLIKMFFLGIIAGGAMFIPGVSGSMLLLIMGEYYLFNSLVANATSFKIDVLVPLGFLMIGIISGVVLSSKITRWALKASHEKSMNFIMGLIVASCVMIIPFDAVYDMNTILTSTLACVLGGVAVTLLEKLVK